MRHSLPPGNIVPYVCFLAKFGHSMDERNFARNDPLTFRLSTSLKFVGTNADRWATYDFLLVFHRLVGITMGLSRTVLEVKGNICKIFARLYI